MAAAAKAQAIADAELRIKAAMAGQSGGGRVAYINAAIDLFNEKPKKGIAEAVRLGCDGVCTVLGRAGLIRISPLLTVRTPCLPAAAGSARIQRQA